MNAKYQKAGLTLAAAKNNDPELVRALQEDLRCLGYLKSGIDGKYGPAVASAVRSLCFDLLNHQKLGDNSRAAVAISSFNDKPEGGKHIAAVQDDIDQNIATVIAALVNDARIGTLPKSSQPLVDNAAALEAIRGIKSPKAPTPFIAAIVVQESSGAHFRVPTQSDADSFVTVGLDRNKPDKDQITSRGYGIGQYTFFHHPLSPSEIAEYVADPVINVQHAFSDLRQKFDSAVVGNHGADDRAAEHPQLPLRLCKYAPSDKRYMSDCRNCGLAVRRIDIDRGTPAYPGASLTYQPTQYYQSAYYPDTPDRAEFPCDWPYAVRRYNGGGVNSYHYQTRILRILIR